MNIAPTPIRNAFRFRGRSFLALVLTPELPLANWLTGLDGWLARSPGFFAGKPLVLDVTGLPLLKHELAGLVEELNARNIRILGIEGADPSILTSAMPPALTGGRTAGYAEKAESPAAATAPVPALTPSPPAAASSLLIDTPVRSGQSIVHMEGDVTVLASVASGAEIVAGGSIHVYGTLRGRALAGINGDARARIFCRKLEAELLAIDGYYRIAEEVDPKLHRKAVHAWLDGGRVNIATLD